MANLLSTTVNGQLNTGNVIDLGYTVNGSIATTEFRGINFHAFSDLHYYIGKPAGAWTQPLHIHFYTGIWIRSHHSYGGTRFYNIATGSQLMSVGDGSDIVNIYSGLTVNGSLINTGASYLGIIYDYDNNNYYLNPTGTSVVDRVVTTGRLEVTHNADRYQMNFLRGSGSNWWVTNDSGSLGLHLDSVGDKFYFGTDGDFWSSTNGWLSTALGAKQNASTAINTSNIGSQSVSYASSAGSSNTASYLPTLYAGGVQANPQTYFSNTTGLRVAMTGSWSVWSDTLWINGYSGSDVKSMNALHFLRNGEPRFAISTQNHDATSYGTYYEAITAYNIASQSVSYASSAGNADTVDGYHMNQALLTTSSPSFADGTFGSTDGATNQGIQIRYQNYGSGYGRIRFYQSNSNHSTIHSFSSSWQSGSLAGHSTGAINIAGSNGVTFGDWDNVDMWIDRAGNAQARGSLRAPIFYDSDDT